jgi:membrane fusion protein
MSEHSLFRKEVIENQKYQNWGSIFINTPIQYQLVSGFFITLAFALILLILFGEFSEKYIVSGCINSIKGMVRVFPNKNGIIIKSTISPGKQVKKGDRLFVIDTSNDGLSEKENQGIFAQLKKRKKSYQMEVNRQVRQINALKKLLDKKYISLNMYNKKHEELTSLRNNISIIDTDLIKYKQGRSYTIRSPIDGTVAGVIYKEGQYINLSKPLVKILPLNSALEAELFIPIRKSGFLHKNVKVIIRYDAYPYERFGTYKATIKDVSQSILTDDEEDKPIKIGEPYYKATATLENQFVTLYGKNIKLQHGMTVTAIILGSKRKIWQWILDPIYSFYGGATL